MRLTDIKGCEVRSGRVVEWRLSPAAVRTAAALPQDPRPAAYIQEAHLRLARSVERDGRIAPTWWIGTAFDIPGRVDLDALDAALRTWTLRHETLRSGFRWAGDEVRRFTLAPSAVSLQREVVGDFDDAEAVARYLQDRFDTEANPLGWPNFLFAAVVRDEDTSVYMVFDHSNVDGYSVRRIPTEIHDLYTARRQPGSTPVAPVSSYVDFCEIERAAADRVDEDHAIVERWRHFIRRGDGRLPGFPLDLGLDPADGPPPQRGMFHMLVDADAAAAFEAYCRPFGGSLVGVLAATGLIAQEVTGQDVYRTVVPFQTRMTSRWSESVGWYVGSVPLEIPLEPAPDFPGLLRTVRAELRTNRPMSRIPLDRVLRLLGSDFRPVSPDLHSIVSFLDSRAIAGSDRWAELKAYGLARVSYGDQACVWINRVHEGLWLACRYPDTDIACKSMRLYAERLRDLILSVTRVPAARDGSAG